ncbi:MAG: NADH-quinone oxidoreductase subunit A [Chloroflexi bacterium]|nr:NADH-quinone oxidoreductase subunit A [Chloroflexota bacterium]
MLADYGYVGLLLIVAILFPLSTIIISFLFRYIRVRPEKPDPVKASTYECGVEPIGPAWVQFNFRYYLYALLFVIFDVETVFLYPWAVALRQLKVFGFIEMVIFMLILVLGYIYGWKKKALEWK